MQTSLLNQRPTHPPNLSTSRRSSPQRASHCKESQQGTLSPKMNMQSNASAVSGRHTLGWALILIIIVILVVLWRASFSSMVTQKRDDSSPTNIRSSSASVDNFLDTATGAFMAKLVASAVILILSILGVVTPLWWSRNASDGVDKKNKSSTSPSFISIGNCFSAGLLLGMGALHFLPEAVEAHLRRMNALSHHHHPMHSEGHEHSHDQKLVFMALVVGLCIPLLIDSVQHSFERWGLIEEHHGHSHGHPSQHPSDGPSCLPDEDHAPLKVVSADVQVNENSPTNTAISTKSAKPPSSSTPSGVVILACLLTFHGLTEGFMLGLEQAGTVIISILLPLGIHKYFDAFVLGLRMADRMGSGQLGDRVGMMNILRKSFWTLVAVFSTPLSLVVIALFDIMTSSPSVPAPSSSITTGTTLAHQHHLPTKAYIASQAIGAGSFLYIALGDILPLEFKGSSSPAYRWRQLLWVALGVLFVHVQSVVFPHEH